VYFVQPQTGCLAIGSPYRDKKKLSVSLCCVFSCAALHRCSSVSVRVIRCYRPVCMCIVCVCVHRCSKCQECVIKNMCIVP
jgi:hypothetical protein